MWAAFWFLICSFLQKGISTLTTPVFTRLMSSAEFGQYNVFVSWMDILTVFVTLRMCGGMYLQGLVKFQKESRAYSSSLQGLTLVLYLAWSIAYILFHHVWNRLLGMTTTQMLAMLLTIWLTAVFGFWAAEKRVEYRYQHLVAVTLFTSIAKPALGIFLVSHASDKVTARIVGIALVETVAYVGLFMAQMRRGRTFYSKKFWRYALSMNIPLIPHYLAGTILNGADRIMIEKMIGSSEAGIYSLAYSIAMVTTLFNTALQQTIEPWIYQKIKTRRIGEIGRVAYPAMIFIAAMELMLIGFAPEIVAVFAPPEYREAIWVIPPVAISMFFTFIYTFFADFEFYFEHTRSIAFATLLAALANIVLNGLFIRVFGYYAAGYTTLVCYVIYAMFHYHNMRKICREHLEDAEVYRPPVLAAIIGGLFCGGLGLMAMYCMPVLRYLLMSIVVALLFINHKALFGLFAFLPARGQDGTPKP